MHSSVDFVGDKPHDGQINSKRHRKPQRKQDQRQQSQDQPRPQKGPDR